AKRNTGVSISGKELTEILERAADTAAEEINGGYYTLGPEIVFEYAGRVHFAGVKYDKKSCKKEGMAGYSEKYLSLYLDKEALYGAEVLDGEKLMDISDGIIVSEEYFQ
ncbi:MAG: hypothetical protein OSJ44_15685, partial [Lachnospiraceae bacterium]|nr:hypothetical protein [Lachnospiraceae bacterium]